MPTIDPADPTDPGHLLLWTVVDGGCDRCDPHGGGAVLMMRKHLVGPRFETMRLCTSCLTAALRRLGDD